MNASGWRCLGAVLLGAILVLGSLNGWETAKAAVPLARLPDSVISGTVRDAVAGWPLYARIDIAGGPADPPAPPLWTDPATGFYSVTLATGAGITLSATSWSGGYQPFHQSIHITESQTVNLELHPDLSTCSAPGYFMNSPLAEDFDGVLPPALPEGWAFTRGMTATEPTRWTTSAGTHHPEDRPAYSGSNLAVFNSFDVVSGDAARLYTIAGVDLRAVANPQLSFAVYHDSDFPDRDDRVQVQVSTDGVIWQEVGGPILRYSGAEGWVIHSVDLAAYAGAASLRIGFLATSGYGNDLHLDSIRLGDPDCRPGAGGLLVGNVYDANTAEPLVGAPVMRAGGRPAVAKETADPAVEEGFYLIFAPAGAQEVTAGMAGGYTSQTVTVTGAASTTLVQDFFLPAGRLAANPAAASVTLGVGQSMVISIELANAGGAPAALNLYEVNRPAPDFGLSGRDVAPIRQFEPGDSHRRSLEGGEAYSKPPVGVPQITTATVVLTWATGLTAPWGVGYNLETDDLWIGNPAGGELPGDDRDYQFGPDGVRTGAFIDIHPWVGDWAADMAYDPFTERLWQVNVGGDDCIYELDPATTAATGRKLCPAFGSSQRGLAFDPATDTFFAGSWNGGRIYRFDRKGVILEAVEVGLPVAGLAYNPMNGHLFVTANGDDARFHDIYILDAWNGYGITGALEVPGMGDYAQAGLEIDCAGRLWAVDLRSGLMSAIDSGEREVCGWLDIPWLSVAPATATLAAGDSTAAILNFDAAGIQPGQYRVELIGLNDTPYEDLVTPLTLTVTAPDTWGAVAGRVTSGGYCDGDSIPLRGAEVRLEDGAELSVTTTTAADGSFQYWMPEPTAPLTVTIHDPEHLTHSVTGITVTRQATTTVDAALRRRIPCLQITPAEMEVTLPLGMSTRRVLTVTNRGAQSSSIQLKRMWIPTSTVHSSTPAPGTGPAGVRTAARYTPTHAIFNEGFEAGAMPPAGWSLTSANSLTWRLNAYPYSGRFGAAVDYALTAQDEWLLSPEVNPEQAVLSFWSSGSLNWCRDIYDNCDLNVWLVVGALGGSDDIFIGKADPDWAAGFTYAQSVFDLTPFLPDAPVRIGLQYWGKRGAQIAVDDIVLDAPPEGSLAWLRVTPANAAVAADGVITVTLELTSELMLAPGTTYPAALLIKSQDPVAPLRTLPIRLRVTDSYRVFLPLAGRAF